MEKCFDETFSTVSRRKTVGLTKRQNNVIILLVAEGVSEIFFSEATLIMTIILQFIIKDINN